MTIRGGGGGRDRFRRDFPSSRFESNNPSYSKRGNNPPSRHLWVGNLSHSIIETDLTDYFLQFGELESVAFQQARSYAFINFNKEEDAIAAIKSLQGFPLAGNPLRIEFAKADKSSTPSHDEDFLQRRDEQRPTLRGSPFSQRDSRVRNASPETFYTDKSKMSDNSAEPSEVLWIGFPALLKVDEMILRKSFSPFGEIEKITVFPGRSYAFVQFKSLMSACRAKETLQGKLFGNPRVHICFAKSEAGSSTSGRTPLSPHYKPNSRQGTSVNFRRDRNFSSINKDSNIRSPHFISDLDPEDSDVGFNRKANLHRVGSNTYDNWRFGEELAPPPDEYECHSSPTRGRDAHFHEFAQKFHQKGSLYEEPWDSPEDSYMGHGTKKLRLSSFPPEKELPEYPFSDLEQEKRAFPQALPDFPQPEAFDKNFEPGPFYKPIQGRPINLSLPHGERSNPWKLSYDNFPAASGSLRSNCAERKRYTPEPEQSSLNLWKWEGTIAKGGTPVCHARCFPVGKVLDMMLPEFLDCTARTGLDMLAKHYYQAASAWVVFFVPATDADIGYYNELMHYLEEKQRAAVAKLDDKTTLFLVPPSDFSEKVLKVPGKLSISGVILRLEHPGSNLGSLHRDPSYPRPPTPSGSTQPILGHPLQRRNPGLRPNWSPPHSQSILSGNRNGLSSNTVVDPVMQEYHSVLPRVMQENVSTHCVSEMPNNPLSVPVSLPIAGLQPQQLAQLASSLIGRQMGNNSNGSASEDFRLAMDQPENQFGTAKAHGLPNNHVGPELLTSQFGQLQQLQQQQMSNAPIMPPQLQKELQPGALGNPQMQSSGTREEADGDPQKRLQATLQLAAALLQQIQQGKGT